MKTPMHVAKKLAIQFGELLDDRNLPLRRAQELDAIAILAGAEDWAEFKTAPERFRGGPNCKQERGEAMLRHLNNQTQGYAVGPTTFVDVLAQLDLPVSWKRT